MEPGVEEGRTGLLEHQGLEFTLRISFSLALFCGFSQSIVNA